MRREGKLGLARTLRGCCAGRGHTNPMAGENSLRQLRRLFTAWRAKAGVSPARQPWRVNQSPNCCGSSSKVARICFGHNYSHIANCSMCRHGNPSKSMKRNRGTVQRQRHLELLNEVRCAKRDATDSSVEQKSSNGSDHSLRRRQFQVVSTRACQASQPSICDNVGHESDSTEALQDAAFNVDTDIPCVPLHSFPRRLTRKKPLKLLTKCRKCCFDCQPRRTQTSFCTGITESCLGPNMPSVDHDWELVSPNIPPMDQYWELV